MRFPFSILNIYFLMGFCFSLFCYSSCTAQQNPSSESNDPASMQRIQSICDGLMPPVIVEGEPVYRTKLMDRMAAYGIPAVSIAVIHNVKIDWASAFGYTKEEGLPVTAETLFQAGSISKPVAAMAALRLADSGKIDLDVDIANYLDSWKIPSNKYTEQSPVTLTGLLSHTAGMTVNGFPGYTFDDPIPNLVQVLNGEKPAYTPPIIVDTIPGKIWRYSGGGYEVMQLVLQDTTGKPFPELMQELVLGPVCMRNSTFEQPLTSERLREAAMPHQKSGIPVLGGARIYPETAAAGLWSTPSDLARFAIRIQEILSGKSDHFLSLKTARRMVTPVLQDYGLGLHIGGSKINPYFYHSGGNTGFYCNLVAYNNGEGAVIMTNSDNGMYLANEILRTIAYEYGWPDFRPVVQNKLDTSDTSKKDIATNRLSENKEITLSSRILTRYTGTYQVISDINLMVTLEGGQLMAQRTGQRKVPIFAMSETKFFFKEIDAQIEFFKDETDDITHLVIYHGGQEVKLPRISKAVAVHKEIAVSHEILTQYAGTYEIPPGVDMRITLENDHLFSQIKGELKYSLFAETETKFFSKVEDATIEFTRDDQGAVTYLVIYRYPNRIKAYRK
jgi:CubicO group peptidase (beta-lactamase class C family)